LLGGGFNALDHLVGNREFIKTLVKHPGDGGFAHVAVLGDVSESDPVIGALSLFFWWLHVFPYRVKNLQ